MLLLFFHCFRFFNVYNNLRKKLNGKAWSQNLVATDSDSDLDSESDPNFGSGFESRSAPCCVIIGRSYVDCFWLRRSRCRRPLVKTAADSDSDSDFDSDLDLDLKSTALS